MQILKIKKGNLKDKVLVPPSKSYANRALIIASLLKKSPKLKNLPKATDVTILLNSLNKIGLDYEEKGEYLNFLNSFPECESEQTIKMEVGEGGTTARFLATMFLLGKSTYTLILGERLKHRPWDTFIDLARSLGAIVSLQDEKLTINGPIEIPEKLEVDCTKTTQFASAFQLLTVIQKKSKITPVNMTSSKSYWAMTEKMITDLCHCEVYEIPKDWSSASYPMAFAALNHQITFPGLTLDSFQADSKFADLLTSFQ